MMAKLCVRMGMVIGGAVGTLISLLHGFTCCGPPHPPAWNQLALDGVLVALVAAPCCALFAWLVNRYPFPHLFVDALLIAIAAGILIGPPAYHIPLPWLALLAGAIAGGLLGWLICRLLCARRPPQEISR